MLGAERQEQRWGVVGVMRDSVLVDGIGGGFGEEDKLGGDCADYRHCGVDGFFAGFCYFVEVGVSGVTHV